MENWQRLSHMFVTVFLSNFTTYLVYPAMPDVIVEAVCRGKDECSLSIFLSGAQQAITGLGAVLMIPLIGKLSDVYGRKTILHIPLTLAIIPLVILAWKRTTNYFYAYYVVKILTAMFTEGGVLCLSLGYLADNVPEGHRVSAFGVLSGVVSAANLSATLIARFLSVAQIFQVALAVSIVALVYMRVFLKEKGLESGNPIEEPILKPTTAECVQTICEPSKKMDFIQEIPSPKDVIRLLRTSLTFSLLACVTFCDSLQEAGVQASLLYYLKAQFHFKKDQFADILLIACGSATVSNLFFLPTVGPFIGEETLLVLAMFAGFLHMLFSSIAWSSWVLYASSSLTFFFCLATPILKCLVSKHTGPNEQGIAQGCIIGITSLAFLVSPLIYSPITALFLSDKAPFHFPGFSILCLGFAYLIGLFLSIWIKIIAYISRDRRTMLA